MRICALELKLESVNQVLFIGNYIILGHIICMFCLLSFYVRWEFCMLVFMILFQVVLDYSIFDSDSHPQ
jgi:hypothetical protein